jgi:predicted nucleotidyltransferase
MRINEFTNLDQDYVEGNIEYHNQLSPNAWKDGKMLPDVRKKLLEIAQAFAKSLNVPNFKIYDVVLAGSMVNYNYTKFSDFDIHLVTSYKDLKCDNLAEEFYTAKKTVWNQYHDITINGHEAELYVEDLDQPPVSGGIYSILDQRWIKKPIYSKPKINDHAINAKVKDLIHQINTAIKQGDDQDDFHRIIEKIKKMRQSGLDRAGEYSTENLSFKILRNLGYIKKLYDAYNKQQDQDLSLDKNAS